MESSCYDNIVLCIWIVVTMGRIHRGRVCFSYNYFSSLTLGFSIRRVWYSFVVLCLLRWDIFSCRESEELAEVEAKLVSYRFITFLTKYSREFWLTGSWFLQNYSILNSCTMQLWGLLNWLDNWTICWVNGCSLLIQKRMEVQLRKQ